MKILALDIATNVGWAFGDGSIRGTQWGTLRLHDLAHDFGQMSAAFSGWVADILTEHGPELAAFERVGWKGPNTYRLSGLLWDAHRIAWLRGVPRIEYAPASIKKFATGSGKANKADMQAALFRRGFMHDTDHEADAIALLLLARERAREKEAA